MEMKGLSRLWTEFKPQDRIDASPLIVQKPIESPDPFHSIYFSRAELKDREDLSYSNKWNSPASLIAAASLLTYISLVWMDHH